ncbi:hypothetical protein [Nocardioides pakistanensis]
MTREALGGVPTTLLTVAVLGSVAITGMTHDAPLAGYVGQASPQKPANTPAWSTGDAAAYPGCGRVLPVGDVPSSVVVVRLTGEVTKMDFDQAWERTHNDNAADDVWVIGACA